MSAINGMLDFNFGSKGSQHSPDHYTFTTRFYVSPPFNVAITITRTYQEGKYYFGRKQALENLRKASL